MCFIVQMLRSVGSDRPLHKKFKCKPGWTEQLAGLELTLILLNYLVKGWDRKMMVSVYTAHFCREGSKARPVSTIFG